MLERDDIITILCKVSDKIAADKISVLPDKVKLQLVISLSAPLNPEQASILQQACTSALMDGGETRLISVALTAEQTNASVKTTEDRVKIARKIIAVGSGKGGVGKSTLSLNLAVALAQQGNRIGLLDADIYGPSLGQMLGIDTKPDIIDGKAIPVEKFGIKSISMSYLLKADDAVVWRAPMVVKALQQFLHDVTWHDDGTALDYLVIDLPPGTGDIPLTIAQQSQADGVVIITTGHDLSMIDAKRAMVMFEKLNIPIIGIVENMAGFTCPHCGGISHIFDALDMEQLAEREKTELLTKIPLQIDIRGASDNAIPLACNAKNPPEIIEIFKKLAEKIIKKMK